MSRIKKTAKAELFLLFIVIALISVFTPVEEADNNNSNMGVMSTENHSEDIDNIFNITSKCLPSSSFTEHFSDEDAALNALEKKVEQGEIETKSYVLTTLYCGREN